MFQLNGMKGLLVKFISYPMLWLSFLLSNEILFQNPDDLNMIRRKGLLWRNNYDSINGSGVNLNEFEFVELGKKPVFTMISRLTGSKGVNEYIKAARIVKQMYPEAIFNLIGPIDDNADINQKKLQQAHIEGTVKLIGKVEDVRPFLKETMVFVLPSYYPEGIPRSILEAMAMGRPIITTNSTGCKETVIDGENGFLVPPRDVNSLVDKMVWMIENSDKVERMGKRSREICVNKFDVYKINEKMLKKISLI